MQVGENVWEEGDFAFQRYNDSPELCTLLQEGFACLLLLLIWRSCGRGCSVAVKEKSVLTLIYLNLTLTLVTCYRVHMWSNKRQIPTNRVIIIFVHI